MQLNYDLLIEYCIKLNPKRAKKCDELVKEIDPFLNFVSESLMNTNYIILIIFSLIIILISIKLTNGFQKFWKILFIIIY